MELVLLVVRMALARASRKRVVPHVIASSRAALDAAMVA
jgi:hypothetical protein